MVLTIEKPNPAGYIDIKMIEGCSGPDDAYHKLVEVLKNNYGLTVKLFFSNTGQTDEELRKNLISKCKGVIGKG